MPGQVTHTTPLKQLPVIEKHTRIEGEFGTNWETVRCSGGQWAVSAVRSLLDGLSHYPGNRTHKLSLFNNELIARQDPKGLPTAQAHATQVVQALHCSLNEPDVEKFMGSYGAFAVRQRFCMAGLDNHGVLQGEDMHVKANNPTGWFKAGKQKARHQEIQRAEPLAQGSTAFVYQKTEVLARVSAAVRDASLPNLNGFSAEALGFELQKLSMIIGSGTPESVLRSNPDVVKDLMQVMTTNYETLAQPQVHALAVSLSRAYRVFMGEVAHLPHSRVDALVL